jgi:hypothetical protein
VVTGGLGQPRLAEQREDDDDGDVGNRPHQRPRHLEDVECLEGQLDGVEAREQHRR